MKLPTLPGAVVDFGARSRRRRRSRALCIAVSTAFGAVLWLIGVAFSIQSWPLAAAFVVVIGAVVGAVTSDYYSARRATASISTS